MRLVRYLQHWLGGIGPRLHVADFVPETLPIRQWADTFPWAPLWWPRSKAVLPGVFPDAPHVAAGLFPSGCC